MDKMKLEVHDQIRTQASEIFKILDSLPVRIAGKIPYAKQERWVITKNSIHVVYGWTGEVFQAKKEGESITIFFRFPERKYESGILVSLDMLEKHLSYEGPNAYYIDGLKIVDDPSKTFSPLEVLKIAQFKKLAEELGASPPKKNPNKTYSWIQSIRQHTFQDPEYRLRHSDYPDVVLDY